MEPRDRAYADWKAGMKYKDIADKYGVTVSAVKSWANRYWKQREVATKPSKKLQPKTQKVATKKTARAAPVPLDKQLADAVEENEELTPQQRDFCLYYSRIKNATQAYIKAYGCSYNTAMTEGCRLLVNPKVKDMLRHLREIKAAMLDEICGEDLDELHARIAFADITDFVEFAAHKRPMLRDGKPVMLEHPKTGEKKVLTQTVNEVNFKSSDMVDGQLITEVSVGRDGVKMKLVDKQRSLAYLERQKRISLLDQLQLELDRQKVEAASKQNGDGTTSASEQLVTALTEAYKARKAARDDA